MWDQFQLMTPTPQTVRSGTKDQSLIREADLVSVGEDINYPYLTTVFKYNVELVQNVT